MIPVEQRDAIARMLSQMVPADHRFFFIALPIKQEASDRGSTTLENVPIKKELARTLRICANYYDPKN